MEGKIAVPAQTDLGAEAVALLQELLRIDTSNPPGNERPAQELCADLLTDAGFACELLGAEAERPNLIARLAGQAPGPTLCLLSHIDTVPADPSEWSFDPWCGELRDGQVLGRGAQDMKDQVAAELAAAASLGREDWRPEAGELLVVVTCDEEAGSRGARWLCSEHPEKVRADLVLNEGGGAAFEVDGRRLYTLCVGEKGVFRFRLRARGTAGHASIPAMGDNALLKLAPALARLREQPGLDPAPEGLAFITALSGERLDGSDPEAVGAALERLRAAEPLLASYLVEPMLRVTMVPTQARASGKENVIPSSAELVVDCRVPPGLGAEEVRQRAGEVLGGDLASLELEFIEQVVGNRSPADAPFAGSIAAWLAAADPGAGLVPMLLPGFSDSHWFRRTFPEAVVYGFCPQRAIPLGEAAPLVHGADERAAAADVELAARFFRDIATEVLG
jgi:acetylornithine deacetylase/succinyl-diaminopimelate desuccinylase-like protein